LQGFAVEQDHGVFVDIQYFFLCRLRRKRMHPHAAVIGFFQGLETFP